MKKRVSNFFKYYSNFIFPILIFLICFAGNNKTAIFLLNNDKMSLIVSAASSFIGVLLTILTIYLAVPKNAVKIKQLKESKHQHIYFANLLSGIILSFFSIIVWILFDNAFIACASFLASIANMIITIYYTFSLIKIMES